MGLKFGNLYKLHGIIYYKISPFEQRAFAGLGKTLAGIPRRSFRHIFEWGIPLSIAYVIYVTYSDIHKQTLRKNPDDYKDDI